MLNKKIGRMLAIVIFIAQFPIPVYADIYELGRTGAHDHLERYLDRASRESVGKSWLQIAQDGIVAAVARWELVTIHVRETDDDIWNLRRNEVNAFLQEYVGQQYAIWVFERFIIKSEKAILSELSNDLFESAKSWEYQHTEGGTRVIKREDVLDARKQWNDTIADSIVEKYIEQWNSELGITFPEVSKNLDQENISEIKSCAMIRIREEYQRISQREENTLMMNLLYDQKSLKKKSAEQAASAILNDLTEKVINDSSFTMDELFHSLELEVGFADVDNVEINSEDWLRSFNASFNESLDKWNDAERRFLVERVQWEQNAEEIYLNSETAWENAFLELRRKKESWHNEIVNRIQVAIKKWSSSQDKLELLISIANEEFIASSAAERRKTEERIDMQITIYNQSREMLDMTLTGIEYWLERWSEKYNGVYSYWKTEDAPSYKYYLEDLFESGYIEGVIEKTSGREFSATITTIQTTEIIKKLDEWKKGCLQLIKSEYQLCGESLSAELIENKIKLPELEIEKQNLEKNLLEFYHYCGHSGMNIHGGTFRLNTLAAIDELTIQIESNGLRKAYLDKTIASLHELNNYVKNFEHYDLSGKEIDEFLKELQNAADGELNYLPFYGKMWDAAEDFLTWCSLMDTYTENIHKTVSSLYKETGGIYGSLAGDKYIDELECEIIKAQAVQDYWQMELKVAEELEAYSRTTTSEIDWEEKTSRQVDEARNLYKESLDEYENLVAELDLLLAQCNEINYSVEGAKSELLRKKASVEEARKAYNESILVLQGVGDTVIKQRISAVIEKMHVLWSDTQSEKQSKNELFEAARDYSLVCKSYEVDLEITLLLNGGYDENGLELYSIKDLQTKSDNAMRTSTKTILEQIQLISSIDDGHEELRLLMYRWAEVFEHDESSNSQKKTASNLISCGWKTYAQQINQEIIEQKSAVRYLVTGSTGLSVSSISFEERTIRNLQVWFMVQLELLDTQLMLLDEAAVPCESSEQEEINSYLKYLEVKNLLEGRKDILNNLLEYSNPEELFAEIKIMRYDSFFGLWITDLVDGKCDFELVAPGWAQLRFNALFFEQGYINEKSNIEIERRYGLYSYKSINQKNKEGLETISEIINNYSASYESFLVWEEFILDLQDAATELLIDGKVALDTYISEFLEYGAAYLIYNERIPQWCTTEVVKKEIAEQIALLDIVGSWKYSMTSCNNLLSLLLQSQFVKIADPELKEAVINRTVALLYEEVPLQILINFESNVDVKEYLEIQEDNTIITSSIFNELAECDKDEISKKLFLSIPKYTNEYNDLKLHLSWIKDVMYDPDKYTEEFTNDSEIQRFMNIEIESIPEEYRNKSWTPYWYAGEKLLYLFLLSPIGFSSIEEALPLLKEMNFEFAEVVRSYYIVQTYLKNYVPVIDGDVSKWLLHNNMHEEIPLTTEEIFTIEQAINSGNYLPNTIYYESEYHNAFLNKNDPFEIRRKRLEDGYEFLINKTEEALRNAYRGLRNAELHQQLFLSIKKEKETNRISWIVDAKKHSIEETPGLSDLERELVLELYKGDSKIISELLKRIKFRNFQTGLYFSSGEALSHSVCFNGFDPLTIDTILSKSNPYVSVISIQEEEKALSKRSEGYTALVNRERVVIGAINSYYKTLESFASLAVSLDSIADNANNELRKSQQEYDQARTSYELCVAELVKASDSHNTKVAEVYAAYADVEDKRKNQEAKQEIYDWASSVYLGSFGSNTDEGVYTPKEHLSDILFASNRSTVALEVLLDLKEGYSEKEWRGGRDKEYEEKFSEYRIACQQYYLARAIKYEVSREVERMEDVVREAERAERIERESLIVKTLPEINESFIEKLSAVSLKKESEGQWYSEVAYMINPDETVPIGNHGVTPYESIVKTDICDLEEYFTVKNIEYELVDNKEYRTRAQVDTLEWLSGMISKEAGLNYLDDISMAALYFLIGYSNTNPEFQKIIFDENNNPHDTSEFLLDNIPSSIHNFSITSSYKNARYIVLENAYKKVISDEQGKADLTKYLLFRETTLAENCIERERFILETRSLKLVVKDLSDEAKKQNKKGLVFAASAGSLAIAAIFCSGLWAAVAALTIISVQAYTIGRDISDIREDVNSICNGKIILKNDEDLSAVGKFDSWIAVYNDFLKKREKLDRYYGMQNDSAMTYEKLMESAEEILETGQGAVSISDFRSLFTRSVFDETDTSLATGTSDTVHSIVLTYGTEAFLKKKMLDELHVLQLQKNQQKCFLDMDELLYMETIIPTETSKQLRAFALTAGDMRLSIEEREIAKINYDIVFDSLMTKESATQFKNDYEKKVKLALGNNSWFQKDHDKRLYELHTSLLNTFVRYDRLTESYTASQFNESKEDLLTIFDHSINVRYEIKQNEWMIAKNDFLQQKEKWLSQINSISKIAEKEWNRAEERFSEDYNGWCMRFKEEYEKINMQWEKNYTAFCEVKQEWITDQYRYATNIANAEALKDAGCSVDEVIARSMYLANINFEKDENQFNDLSYVDDLLADSQLSNIMKYVVKNSKTTGGNAINIRRGIIKNNDNDIAIASADYLIDKINTQMKNTAGKIAAYQASKQHEIICEQYRDRLNIENTKMLEWQKELILNSGYTMGAEIFRNALIKSTVYENIRERQTVHKYEYYKAEQPTITVNLDEGFLNTLDDYAIMLLLDQAKNEMNSYGENLFGKSLPNGAPLQWNVLRDYTEIPTDGYQKLAEKSAESQILRDLKTLQIKEYQTLTDQEKKKMAELTDSVFSIRDGKLGKHIGYAPIFKKGSELDLANSRTKNVQHAGVGQMGSIMLDFLWNGMMMQKGYSELALPMWDKKIWDDEGDFISSPTVRSVVEIAMSIVSMVTAMPLAPFLVGLLDDAFFACLDVSGGYKSMGEVGNVLGKKALIAAASSCLSVGSAKLDVLGKNLEGVSSVAFGAAKAAGTSYATSVVNSYIQAIDFEKGVIHWDQGNKSWNGVDALASAVSAGIAYGAGGLLENKMTTESKKIYGGLQNLGASVAGELTRYGVYAANAYIQGQDAQDAYNRMGGITINAANLGSLVDFFGSSIATHNKTGQSSLGNTAKQLSGLGLFEISFNSNGIHGAFGTNGIDVGGALYDFSKRSYDKKLLEKFAKNHDRESAAAYNAYVYGDWTAENTARRLGNEKDEIVFFESDDSKTTAETVANNSGGRTIYMEKQDTSLNDAIVLQHEAHRDCIISSSQKEETEISAKAHTEILIKMVLDNASLSFDELLVEDLANYFKGEESFKKYIEEAYDSSGEFWKMKANATLEYDGKKDLDLTELGGGILEADQNLSNSENIAKWFGMENDEAMAFLGGAWDSDSKKYTVGASVQMDQKLFDAITNKLSVGNYVNTSSSYYAGVVNGYITGADKTVVDKLNESILAQQTGKSSLFTITNKYGNDVFFHTIDENNPVLSELKSQHDPAYASISAIDSGGCNFLASLAYPQMAVGKVLAPQQTLDIFTAALAMVDPYKPSRMVLESNGTVNNPDVLAALALKKLGR
ncbi:MAG TPA: calcium-binding protein, partial [Treponema sp.]|nr:calcium-binding protein [Treponema sp.]